VQEQILGGVDFPIEIREDVEAVETVVLVLEAAMEVVEEVVTAALTLEIIVKDLKDRLKPSPYYITVLVMVQKLYTDF
jgi:hypothetical protein